MTDPTKGLIVLVMGVVAALVVGLLIVWYWKP